MHVKNIIRLIIVIVTGVVATVAGNVFALVLSLVGGFGGTLLSFVFPTAFHLKLFFRQMKWYLILRDIALLAFGITGTTIATGVTLYQFFEKEK